MPSELEARKIGINACIDKLGREFVKQNATNASSAYGLRDNGFFVLFPYHASCIVNINSSNVQFLDYMVP